VAWEEKFHGPRADRGPLGLSASELKNVFSAKYDHLNNIHVLYNFV
jgi:hypothetical protein